MKIAPSRPLLRSVLLSLLSVMTLTSLGRAETPENGLSERNPEVPFSYLRGDVRAWPILHRALKPGETLTLSSPGEAESFDNERGLKIDGLSIRVSRDGKLHVDARAQDPKKPAAPLDLKITLHRADQAIQTQTIALRPAPPARPISYVADFGDDLIRIFWDANQNRWRPITKTGFDQYFRRLQAHGVSRLIVWLSPFPYAVDPANYAPEDWQRYQRQAQAIVESRSLQKAFTENAKPQKTWGVTSWGWVRQLTAARLMPQFGPMLCQSAADHDIKLTVSFRPFEAALTKYYEIPAFDADGRHLWEFLPMATPVINYHPEKVCFAHYRTVLKQMGHAERGQLDTIEIENVSGAAEFVKRFQTHGDNLRITATDFPPLQEEAFVLQRQPDGQFLLRPYKEIQEKVQSQVHVVTGYTVEQASSDTVRIKNLSIPDRYRYLILSNPTDTEAALEIPTKQKITLRAKAGNRLGHTNVYWVLEGSPDRHTRTRAAGITPNGKYHSEFKAAESSRKFLADGPDRLPLRKNRLVINRGQPWSVEMMDLNQPAMRANVIAEMKTLLKYPAVDELMINTRSHTALINRIDLGYLPRAGADDRQLKSWASDPEKVQRLTCLTPDEWKGECQSAESPYRWRYVRNREVARGVRTLLEELETAFPTTRIRIVLPPREAAYQSIRAAVESMPRPDGTVYGKSYFRNLFSTINHIPTIGEGMALVDLTGLRTEPVVFGIRCLVDQAPFERFVDDCLKDLADNHGSSFRGPRSFFFEAQASLRNPKGRPDRERMIRYLLSLEDEINEVVLYEAADWAYFLPLSDPDQSGYGFLDREDNRPSEKKKNQSN